jgi:ribosomal protein S18 acetylase RimI-like enzyme
MHITPATPDDCPAIAALHVASWQQAYAHLLPAEYLASLSVARREASWRQVLAEDRSELLVARSGTEVLGFVSFGPSRDADAPAGRGEVWALYVSPGAWSTGVGRALWDAGRERLVALGFRSVSLWVLAGNERALRFYRLAGFSVEEGCETTFEMGGAMLREVRLLIENPTQRTTMTPPALAAWHELVRNRNVKGLDALLANDVVFHSPVVHTPQAGKAVTVQYLGAAFHVFFNESFRYVREVVGPSDAVLEFQVEIDGIAVNGVDMIKWNDEGKVVDFKVLVRPLKAINLIHQRMAAMLQANQ